jgi:hypothetical protein
MEIMSAYARELEQDNAPPPSPKEGNAAPPNPNCQNFHSGEKLSVVEASRLLHDRPVRVVLCVGAQDSGKTTFFARLGEMFRDGSFAQFRFATSLTLCAFERATWLATVTSGVGHPKTKRTHRRENDTFLHLGVQQINDPGRDFEVLLSDLAGETFPTAVASRQFCADLCALARADHLCVFLDCAQLTDSAKRHTERDNARAFLQRVIAVKHDPKALRVQILFSRWDYITSHPQRAALEKSCLAIEADFNKRFGASFAELVFKRIAARPDEGRPTNEEIQSLFAHWLDTALFLPTSPAVRNRQPARDFSAFGLI